MQANIKRVHIISRYNGGWAVKKQGAARAIKVYPTKEGAVIGSYPYLQSGFDLVIHRTDGSVEQFMKADNALPGFSMDKPEKSSTPRTATSSKHKNATGKQLRKKT